MGEPDPQLVSITLNGFTHIYSSLVMGICMHLIGNKRFFRDE